MYFLLLKKYKIEFYSLKFIKSQVAQYYIFILLKPEWKAKSEFFSFRKINRYYFNVIKKHIQIITSKYNKNFYSIDLSIWLNYKKINHYYIINKVNSCSNLINRLNSWSSNQNLIQCHLILHYLDKNLNYSDELYNLLTVILYIGFEWYLYVNSKFQNIYNNLFILKINKPLFILVSDSKINKINKDIAMFLNTININLNTTICSIYKYTTKYMYLVNITILVKKNIILKIQPSHSSIKNLFRLIRLNLYHKNKEGFWRINNHISLNQATLQIKDILYKWCSYYSNTLEKSDIIKINTIADNIFYTWQMKRQN